MTIWWPLAFRHLDRGDVGPSSAIRCRRFSIGPIRTVAWCRLASLLQTGPRLIHFNQAFQKNKKTSGTFFPFLQTQNLEFGMPPLASVDDQIQKTSPRRACRIDHADSADAHPPDSAKINDPCRFPGAGSDIESGITAFTRPYLPGRQPKCKESAFKSGRWPGRFGKYHGNAGILADGGEVHRGQTGCEGLLQGQPRIPRADGA